MSILLRLAAKLFVVSPIAGGAAESGADRWKGSIRFVLSNSLIVRQVHAAVASYLFESKPRGRCISLGPRDARGISRLSFSGNHQPTYCHVF